MTTPDLFGEMKEKIVLADGAYYLKGFARDIADNLTEALQQLLAVHPPQKMMTPMGYQMSVLTVSLGDVGFVSSQAGYAYTNKNPHSQLGWPAIPPLFLDLAAHAASKAGYEDFIPDSCLVNVYGIGSKMGVHQDKEEADFSQPVVSVSLGVPAIFLMGGAKRNDKTTKVQVTHGDVVVFGGASRLYFHGVQAIKAANHYLLGKQRINLTFRKAR